jgi:ELWxxDGT repeat protein
VKDIRPGAGGSNPNGLASFNGHLYFDANDGVNGFELWRSDGTAAGTVMVKDINPGAAGSFPFELTVANDLVYFTADGGATGMELWQSDGTTAGTMLVMDIAPGGDSSRTGLGTLPKRIVDIGKAVLFTATDGVSGVELWKTDKLGTFQLQGIAPGEGSSNPEAFAVTKHLIFFLADDNSTGRELWAMPGNEANLPQPAAQNRAGNPHAERNFSLDPGQAAAERLKAEVNNMLDVEPTDPDH